MYKIMSRLLTPPAIVVLVMLLLALVASVRAQSVARESIVEEGALPLYTYEGDRVFLSSYRHPVLIVFSWASWCSYCADEMRALTALKAHYGDSIRIVGVNRGEPRADAKGFSDTLGLGDSMMLLLDPDDAFYKSLGGYAMPEFLFTENRGEVVRRVRGPMTEAELDAQIAAMR